MIFKLAKDIMCFGLGQCFPLDFGGTAMILKSSW